MSLTVVPKEAVKWTEGNKTGKIVKLQEKLQVLMPDGKTRVDYVDVVVEDDVTGNLIKTGFANKVSESTNLGAFLKEMKVDFKTGVPLDLEKALIGKGVSFMVVNRKGKTGDKKFANIVEGTLALNE